jgi:hypothetical protein
MPNITKLPMKEIINHLHETVLPMNSKAIVLLCAIPLGLAGGYAWSAMTAPPPRPIRPPKAKMIAVPPSPSEYPEADDASWSARSDDTAAAANARKADESVHCSPGKMEMDGDGDGIACDPHPAPSSNER